MTSKVQFDSHTTLNIFNRSLAYFVKMRVESRLEQNPDQEKQERLSDAENFEQQVGELPDGYTSRALNYCHKIVAKLPELTSRYKTYKGTIAISAALLSAVSIAVTRRMRDGHNPDQILQEISAEEVIAATKLEREDDDRRFKKLAKLIKRQIARAKNRP